jgi:hypothetical protein
MTRDYVLVLVPDTVQRADIERYTQDLFLPFMRDYEFPPYECLCECIDADAEYREIANTAVGYFHVFWRSYTMLPPPQRPEWREYIQEWVRVASNIQSAPEGCVPNPDCDLCKGSGVRTVTWYPHDMYDYWVGLTGDILGSVSQLAEVLRAQEVENENEDVWYDLAIAPHEPFYFYQMVTPDGQSHGRDHLEKHAWWRKCRQIFDAWPNCIVVRCLVHW